MKKYLIVMLLSVLCVSLFAQRQGEDTLVRHPLKPRFLYGVDAALWFDNREYKGPIQSPQTLFAMRLSPEVGVGLTDREGGTHRLSAGVHYIQPMGGNWRDVRLIPTVYYQYQFKGFSMNLGAVPYKYFIRQLPDFLRYDSIAYMHPNIQGALLQYQSRHGFVEAMCDWRGMQRPDQREMFRLTIDGEYGYQGFFRYFVGGLAQLNHRAGCAPPAPRDEVCDEAFVSPNIGIDFSAPTPLDTLSLRASYIFGYQRQREDNTKYKPQGGLQHQQQVIAVFSLDGIRQKGKLRGLFDK